MKKLCIVFFIIWSNISLGQAFTKQPVNDTTCETHDAIFEINFDCSLEISFTWQYAKDTTSGDWLPCEGEHYFGVDDRVLNIENTPFEFNGYFYRCRVTVGLVHYYSYSAQLTVDPFPVVNAGQDRGVCSNNEFTAEDATAENYNSLYWTHDGSGSFEDSTELNATYFPGPDDSVVNLILHVRGKASCDDDEVTDILILTVLPIPDAGFSAESTSIKTGEDVVFTPVSIGNYDYFWSFEGVNPPT
jgi:hypothetical protein